MKVRLTRKHAEMIDGVNLSKARPGDLLDLSPQEAQLLLAEQWAIPERRTRTVPSPLKRRAEDRTTLVDEQAL